ncbi:MAG: hypothetical protein ACSHX9_01780 [Luteolibacter sp.]
MSKEKSDGVLKSAASREERPWWFWGSVVLHLAILAWVLFAIPKRGAAGSAEEAGEKRVHPSRIEKIAELIEAQQMRELQRDLAKLEEIRERMEAASDASEERYEETAPAESEGSMEAAMAEAKKAVEALERAAEPQKEYLETLENALVELKETGTTETQNQQQVVEAADRALKEALEAQIEAAGELAALGSKEDGITDEQRNIRDATAEARAAQERAVANAGLADSEQGGSMAQSAQARARAESAEQAVARIESEVEIFKKRIEEVGVEVENLREQQAEAGTEGQKHSQIQLRQRENQIRMVEKKLQGQEQMLKSNRAKAEAARLEGEIAGNAEQMAERLEEAIAAQRTAMQVREDALSAQEQLLEKMASGNFQEPAEAESESDSGISDLAEGLEAARRMEQELAGAFREHRAYELAVLTRMDFERALAATELAVPMRDGALTQAVSENPRTVEKLEAYKEKIAEVRREMESMLSLAKSMSERAAQKSADGTSAGLNADVASAIEGNEELENLAAENGDAVAKDLTAEMRAALGAHDADYGADAKAGSEHRAGGRVEESEAPHVDVTLVVPGRRVSTAMTGVGSAEWMFVDSWWVIGPFPNPNRENIDRKFPPDSVVDLDATYPGKGGGLIRWERMLWQPLPKPFPKGGGGKKGYVAPQPTLRAVTPIQPGVNQEYSIYYAYTELWFEDEKETWIAVGSDDNSKLKINDLPVWVSGRELKIWKADEGYRKVFFKKGLNRVLMRVENGHGPLGWSLMIQVGKRAPGE